MKVTITQHKRYLTTTFTQSEFDKIVKWIDGEFNLLLASWESTPEKKRMSEDELYWFWLVSMYSKIPDGRKTKAFVYQMMVMNDIVNDGLNTKASCWLRHHKCEIEKRWLLKLGRDWQSQDLQNICGNLGICTRLPDQTLFPFNLEFDKDLKELTIDDRILNIKR